MVRIDNNIDKMKKEGIAYKKRGYLDLAREVLERIPARSRDAETSFHIGELYATKAEKGKGELSIIDYKHLLQLAVQSFRACMSKDKGEYQRFTDKRGRVNYFTLSQLAKKRVELINQQLENLKKLKFTSEVKRKKILQWAPFRRVTINPKRK